jgi:hypothetical protein
VFLQKGPHLIPAIHCLLLPVSGAVIIEKAMAGPFVHVELVLLAILL